MKVRADTVDLFFKILEDAKSGKDVTSNIEDIVKHPDYQVEFKRYSNRTEERVVTQNDFIDIFQSIKDHGKKLDKKVNRERKARIIDFIDDIEKKKELWRNFSFGESPILDEAIDIAKSGLPDDIHFDEIELLLTVSIGNSFGWPYKNIVHFDIIQMLDMFSSLDEMKYFFAHEIHHIGFKKYLSDIDIKNDTLMFLHFIAFEGMALKFCNYPYGNLISKCLNEEQKNDMVIKEDWDYYMNERDYYLNMFIDDYNSIKNNNYSSVEKIVYGHWKTEKRNDGTTGLSQFPNYFVGSEVFGMLFDDYGKNIVYQILSGDINIIPLFNDSMNKRKLPFQFLPL